MRAKTRLFDCGPLWAMCIYIWVNNWVSRFYADCGIYAHVDDTHTHTHNAHACSFFYSKSTKPSAIMCKLYDSIHIYTSIYMLYTHTKTTRTIAILLCVTSAKLTTHPRALVLACVCLPNHVLTFIIICESLSVASRACV